MWLEEYLIILVPSTMAPAMSYHKFIFILYTIGYSLVQILYTNICLGSTDVSEEQGSFMRQTCFVSFLLSILLFFFAEYFIMKYEIMVLTDIDKYCKKESVDGQVTGTWQL